MRLLYVTQLSNIGKIITNEWIKTTKIRNNIELGEWIIMPNHFHGIVVLCKISKTHSNASFCVAPCEYIKSIVRNHGTRSI